MSISAVNQLGENVSAEKQWQSIYTLGGIATVIALIGIVLDVIVGSITGGNLSALPQTAVDRFAQFQMNPLLGLYNLDLLNILNQLFLIPAYVAMYAVQRRMNYAYVLLALVVFLVGTTIFV